MKILVGLSRNNSIFSKIIRWFTKSEVSHAFVIIDDVVLHAGFPYVMGWFIANFIEKNTIVYIYEVEVPSWRVKWAFAQAGKCYGFRTLIGIAIVLLSRKVGIHINNPISDGDRTFVCSEFVAKVVNYVIPEDVTPQDLYEHLEKTYGRIQS